MDWFKFHCGSSYRPTIGELEEVHNTTVHTAHFVPLESATMPEPTLSDQVREPATASVPVGMEYEGMEWSPVLSDKADVDALN